MNIRYLLCACVLVLGSACGESTTETDAGTIDGGRSDSATTNDSSIATDSSVETDGAVASDMDVIPTDSSVETDSAVAEDGGASGDCTRNFDCEMGEYCAHSTGSCTATGTCTARPSTSDCAGMTISPVCGCDGETYAAACLAAMDGVSVDTTGECPGPVMCPTEDPSEGCCYDNSDCGGGPGGGFAMRCAGADCSADPVVAGVCLERAGRGECWSDADCRFGTCTGAVICPCGAICEVPNTPGTCAM